jgi:hypothetical protein
MRIGRPAVCRRPLAVPDRGHRCWRSRPPACTPCATSNSRPASNDLIGRDSEYWHLYSEYASEFHSEEDYVILVESDQPEQNKAQPSTCWLVEVAIAPRIIRIRATMPPSQQFVYAGRPVLSGQSQCLSALVSLLPLAAGFELPQRFSATGVRAQAPAQHGRISACRERVAHPS